MAQEQESTEQQPQRKWPALLILPDSGLVREQLNAVRAFQAVVKQTLVDGHDFGIIPGTPKPTLLKPGAEKIVKLLGLSDEYEVVNRMEDWEKGFFAYEVKAILRRQGVVVSSGLGECNSKESKYRWRWVWPRDIPEGISHDTLVKKEWTKEGKKYTQYRVENEDIYSQVNTILKMAKKRALVDAALSAGRLSDVFTQDIEEMQHEKQEVGGQVIEDLWGPEEPQKPLTPPTARPGGTEAPKASPGPSSKATTKAPGEEKRVFPNAGAWAEAVRADGGDVTAVMIALNLRWPSDLKTQEDMQAAWQTHLNLKKELEK